MGLRRAIQCSAVGTVRETASGVLSAGSAISALVVKAMYATLEITPLHCRRGVPTGKLSTNDLSILESR
jgi:hypothetical protein